MKHLSDTIEMDIKCLMDVNLMDINLIFGLLRTNIHLIA